MGNPGEDLTLLLRAWQGGDRQAGDQLAELVYDRLRRLADRLLASESGKRSIQPTELANEAYVQLIGLERMDWQCRTQFFALSASIMRRILVDRARQRHSRKREGGIRVELTPKFPAPHPDADILQLHEALDQLADVDPEASSLVELRFFGGLTVEEAASILSIGRSTAIRRWQYARAWLRGALAAT